MNPRWGLIFLGYVLFVAYLSFYPFQFVPYSRPFSLSWYWFPSRRMVMDFTLNVWFYVPLGAFAFLALGRRFGALLLAVLTGVAISMAVEYGQLFVPGRYSGAPDFVANSLGALIGAVSAYAAMGLRLGPSTSKFVHSAAWRISPDRILLLVFWALGEGFPFFPDLHADRVLNALSSFARFPSDWNPALRTFLAFLILTIALRRSYWIAIAFALIPAQTLLEYHQFSLPKLIAAAAAWALGTFVGGRIKSKPVAGFLSAAIPLGLLAEELRPFQFAPLPIPFGWLPFGSIVGGNATESSGSVFFGKLLLYAGSIWLLRTLGCRMWIGTAAVVAVLALGEWSQRYIPGRVPESTDVVLALGGALLLMLQRRSPAT